jgi:hypothetical protein
MIELLNEGVSETRIIDAIKHHKILHINYAGENTVLKGYRTIRPFVYGTHTKSGKKVVRAWQDAGNSDGYKDIGRKARPEHEKQIGPKGMQPGWRLFLIDHIVSVLPTGYKFKPHEYFVSKEDVEYKPDDMFINVQIAIPKEMPDKTDYDDKYTRFDDFFSHAKENARPITKQEVEHLADIVQNYRKKSKKYYWIVQNDKGDMVYKTKRGIEINNIPSSAIVGNLQDLYNEYVVSQKNVSNKFFDDIKKKI